MPVSVMLIFVQSYIVALFRCLIQSSVKDVSLKQFDQKYFYPDEEEFGKCTCGLARNAAEILIREKNADRFLSCEWLNSMVLFKGKPFVIGSMVEQSCLSAISRFGLHPGNVHIKPKTCET